MSNCISVLFRKGKHHGLALLCMLLVTAFAVTGASAAEPKVRVLATTYPVYLLTRAVAQTSPDVQVDLLIPAQTGCPHDYALTPKDMFWWALLVGTSSAFAGLTLSAQEWLATASGATIILVACCWFAVSLFAAQATGRRRS